MIAFFAAFIITIVVTLLIIRYKHLHGHLTEDSDLDGVQKFHSVAVPRVGGVAIVIGMLSGIFSMLISDVSIFKFGILLILCASPVFCVGLIEDLTKKIGVKERLLAALASSACGGYLLEGWIVRLNIPGLDYLILIPAVSILLTCFAVSGVVNSYNIIDGYNGLAAMVGLMALIGIAYVARQVGDFEIFTISLTLAGAIGGFFLWNYPLGLIFLGDCGAYLIGFVIAELSVLLVARHQQVSPWFPLLLSFYPIFETIFSIYRKKIMRDMSPSLPDGLHLHMLIYKRIVIWAVGTNSVKQKTIRNALTSPYLWVLSGLGVIPSIFFWNNTIALIGFIVLFMVSYIAIYRRIVQVRVPSWIKINDSKKKFMK